MNKHLFLLSILCFTKFLIQAQEFSFTDQGNEWIYNFYTFCGDDSCDDGNGAFAWRINGQETINDIDYAILEVYNYQSPDDSWSTRKYLRTENGVVYELTEEQNETIYLDFTLEVGDEVSFPIDYSDGTTPVVTEVSSQSIAGEVRKVITFDVQNLSDSAYSEFHTIIEGIGFTGDPNSPFLSNPDFSTDITCFSGSTSNFGDCSTLSTDNYLITAPILYPNPLKTISTIKFDVALGIDQVQIFDLSGKLLKNHVIKDMEFHIYREDFDSNGIYFFRCLSAGQFVSSNKFIIL